MKLGRPTAAVLIVVVVAIVAVLLAGPPDVRDDLLAGLGALGALVLAALGPVLRRDADGDGLPWWVDRDEGGE